jgi:hypothetical protein
MFQALISDAECAAIRGRTRYAVNDSIPPGLSLSTSCAQVERQVTVAMHQVNSQTFAEIVLAAEALCSKH